MIRMLSNELCRTVRDIDSDVIETLRSYHWSNIRELKNIVERAVLISDDGFIRATSAPVLPEECTFSYHLSADACMGLIADSKLMILEDVLDFLNSNPPFQLLDAATLKNLAGKMSMDYYPKDTVILKQNGPPSEALRLIKKGGVKVAIRSEDGEEVVMDYKGEGDTFGFLSLIGNDKQKTTVITIDDTICYTINREMVLKLLETSPAFAEYFMSYLSRYVDRTYRKCRTKDFLRQQRALSFLYPVGDIASDAITVNEEVSTGGSSDYGEPQDYLFNNNRQKESAGRYCDRQGPQEKVIAKGRNISEPVKTSLPFLL